MPNGLEQLGRIVVSDGHTQTLIGPGSFAVSTISLSNNGKWFIENSAGPVTLYVTGKIDISTGAEIVVTDPDPEKFALYVVGNGAVSLSNNSLFYGVLYARQSTVTLASDGEFFGAFVARKVIVSDAARVYYDAALQGELTSWEGTQATSTDSDSPAGDGTDTTPATSSTDATASGETTSPSSGPGNGKGKGKK